MEANSQRLLACARDALISGSRVDGDTDSMGSKVEPATLPSLTLKGLLLCTFPVLTRYRTMIEYDRTDHQDINKSLSIMRVQSNKITALVALQQPTCEEQL